MKTIFTFAAAAAALLMASSAQARDGFSFNYDGQNYRVEAPRNCNSLSCVSVTSNGSPVNTRHAKGKKSDDDVTTNSPPPAPPAPAVQAPPAPAPVANTAPPAPAAAANNLPPAPTPAADTTRERLTGLPSAPPAPAARTAPANPAPAAPAPVANAAPPAPPAPPVQQAATDATTPIGVWQTKDNKGNVRIEQCGANLCGFGAQNNESILINMKPSSDNSKWTGRIHDPESGSNYDSTVSMKGPNLLSVQGCAFGGLFCGGQTWKRIS